MARPITPLPVFRGKAAEWLISYLNREITDEERTQRERRRGEDRELLKHVRMGPPLHHCTATTPTCASAPRPSMVNEPDDTSTSTQP